MSELRLRATVRIRNDMMITARKAMGLSQIRLGLLAEVPLASVARLEKLDYSDTRVRRHAECLALCLDIDVRMILPDGADGLTITSEKTEITTVDPQLLLATHGAQRLELPDPHVVLERSELMERVHKEINSCSYKEKIVLTMRLGLDESPIYTLEEVGRKLSCSKERARHIEETALGKIRRNIESDDALFEMEIDCVEDVPLNLSRFRWSNRLQRLFSKHSLTTVGDLLNLGRAGICNLKNAGHVTVEEIARTMATLGVELPEVPKAVKEAWEQRMATYEEACREHSVTDEDTNQI